MTDELNQNIRLRFRKELIEEKTVAFQPELYKMYFHRIFPNWMEFAQFLSTTSEQARLQSAIRIIDRLNFSSNFPIVEDIYSNLIRLESEKLAGKDDSYVGRDHFVHTANIYILGIYLFFNHPVFHSTLMKHFFGRRKKENPLETKNQLAVKGFLSAWKYFACAHDTGYPIEALVGRDKKLKDMRFKEIIQQYENLDNYQAYMLAAKTMSKLICGIFQLENAKHTLQSILESDRDEFECTWIRQGGAGRHQYTLSQITKRAGEFYQLEYIQSYESLKLLMPLIEQKDIAILLRDEGGEPVVLSYCGPDAATWHRVGTGNLTDAQLQGIWTFGSDEFPPCMCSCSYFIRDPKGQRDRLLNSVGMPSYQEDWSKFAGDFFSDQYELYADLSTSSKESSEIVYQIYRILANKIPLCNLERGFLDFWNNEYRDRLNQELKEQVIKTVAHAVHSVKLAGNSEKENFASLQESILGALDLKAKELQPNGGTHGDKVSGRAQRGKMLLRRLYDAAKQSMPQGREILKLAQKSGKTPPVISFNLLGIEANGTPISPIHQKILDRLEQKLYEVGFLNSDQHIADLTRYMAKESAYDHGLASATLLLSTVVNYRMMTAAMKKDHKELLLLAWDIELGRLEKSLEEKSLNILTDSIYAVMLHNLYRSSYQDILGNHLEYRIEQDPFTYLGLLCDGLQMWDRVQQIKPAERSPRPAINGTQFDLKIRDKQILMFSSQTGIEAIKEKCQDLNSYLRGSGSMLQVSGSIYDPFQR